MAALALSGGPALALDPAPPAPRTPPSPSVRQIEQAEAAFAQAVAQTGIGPGFRKFAAPGAIMFLPNPMPANAYLQTAHSPGELVWRPQYIGVAPSDDLAFSLGPSVYKVGGKSEGGYYLTIWKRAPDGSWQFALDHGVDMPASIFDAPPQPAIPLGIAAVKPDLSVGLREADSALDNGLLGGPSTGFEPRLSERIIMVRTNRPVAVGKAKAIKLLAEAPAILEARLLGAGLSADGVLGYTWGKARWSTPAGMQAAFYVRVWRNSGQGWRLMVDHVAER